jgi:hypothetical protein
MSRYHADEATVWVWDDEDRTCVRWRSAAHWDGITCSLKAYFPRHCDLSFSGTRRVWSVPLWRRQLLGDWLSWTFEPACIRWDETGPAGHIQSRSYSAGRCGYGAYKRETHTR